MQTDPLPPTSLPQPASPASKAQAGCLGSLLLWLTLSWIVAIAWVRHAATLTATISPDRTAQTVALTGAGIQLVLTLPLLFVLARFWPNPRYRLIFRGWLAASLLPALTAPAFLTAPASAQAQLLIQILALLILIAILLRLPPAPTRAPAGAPASPDAPPAGIDTPSSPAVPHPLRSSLPASILLGLAVLYPWLSAGALGSILDTLLGLLFCLLLGLAAALILERYLLPALQFDSNFWGDFFLGGLGAGTLLVILAGSTAFTFGGAQHLLLLTLPALGWVIIALQKLFAVPLPAVESPRSPWPARLPVTLLVGLAAAGPVLFIDPDELALVISAAAGEILLKAYNAAFLSLAAGLACSLLCLVILLVAGSRREAAAPGPAPTARAALPLWIAALFFLALGAGIYFAAGQPGFYGERMFVILKDQADVSSARELPDYAQRRQFVYRTLVEHANTSQAGLRQSLDSLGIHYTPYYLVNAIEVGGTPLLRLWLSTRPEVDRILDSPRMRPLPEPLPLSTGSEPAPTGPQWNLTIIGADRVWKELRVTGQGILIGQSDSGVEGTHPELAAAYRGADGDHNHNWFDPWNASTAPTDIGGHGTHTLGSILGKTTGVAPGAQWIACVNLARNLGNPALYLDCWQFNFAPFPLDGDPFVDGDPARGAQVLNNSWGCPEIEGCDGDTYTAAVRALTAAGVYVVASAGNDGPACATLQSPPPIYAEALAVGAMDRFGNLAEFSSIGPVTSDGSQRVKPDVLAPGASVLSAFPGGTYAVHSGTSMAGPHVAGVVALMWSANPALIGDIPRTTQILHQTARPYTGPLPDCPGAHSQPSTAAGYGIVDAYAAVNAALQAKK